MSNEFKLVPVEPDDAMVSVFNEMLEAVDDGCSLSGKELLRRLIANIAAAPQPPALGGEAAAIIGSLERFESDGEDFVKLHDVRDVVQVVIAPLQAEITGFKKERSFLVARNDELHTRNAELESALKFYADREHYHFESGNWDTVSGEPLNILWCGDEPDFIEDGSVARNALSKPAGSEQV